MSESVRVSLVYFMKLSYLACTSLKVGVGKVQLLMIRGKHFRILLYITYVNSCGYEPGFTSGLMKLT